METWMTALAFSAATGFAVWRHVRGAAATASPAGTVCPRCAAPILDGAIRCPRCGAPRQVFEVAAAEALAESEAPEDGGKKPHAVVRADVCVGCGTCVAACPVQAIRMEGKMAIVDLSRCDGIGTCADACPVGGLLVTTGGMTHRVEVPDVRSDFQTNVEGIYIVGELGGRGLIKNAINEGRIAAENVARELSPAGRRGLRRGGIAGASRANGEGGEIHDLAIIGSGPAGLSAGLEAKRAGLSYVILEQGTLADSIRKYPRHKLLLAEPVKVPLYGDLWVADASKETLLQVWETIIRSTGLVVRTGCRVESVSGAAGAFLVRGEGFEVRARRVILALGRRGTPRRLGVPGEEGDRVFYDIVEMEAFRGRKVLVVGGGDSALESAVGLANQEGTEVVLSYRRATFDRAKERNIEKLNKAEESGRVRVLRESAVKAIGPDTVTLDVRGQEQTVPVDNVIVRIGGEPPTRFLEKVGIRTVKKELPLEEAQDAVPT